MKFWIASGMLTGVAASATAFRGDKSRSLYGWTNPSPATTTTTPPPPPADPLYGWGNEATTTTTPPPPPADPLYGWGNEATTQNTDPADAEALDCSFQREIALPFNMILRQIINPVDETVTIELTRPGASWLALGFGSQMVGNTAVVGLPSGVDGEPGEIQKLFLGGKQRSLLTEVDASSLSDASIVQDDTQTVLRFTKPLVEQGETAVLLEGSQNIIVAAGQGNAFGIHEVFFPTSIEMDLCVDPNAVNDNIDQPITPPPTFDPDQELDCTLRRTLSLTSGVSIKEVFDPVEETVTVEMTYESDQGAWLGISLASNGFMVGNVAVIGLPNEPVGPSNPAKYTLGGKSASAVTRLPDDQQTLTNTNLVQNATHTVMTFTQPLREAGQREISTTESNTAIFATGRGNSFSDGLHANFAAFGLQLTRCLAPGEEPEDLGDAERADLFNDEVPNKGLWIFHGLLMAVGWGLLVPLAIGASLARNWLSSKMGAGLWFKLHRGLNSMAMICILVGFFLAIYLVNDSTAPGEDARHFKDVNHRKLGLVIVVLAVVQALSGFARPHAPHAPAAKDDSAPFGEEEAKQNRNMHTGGAMPDDTEEPTMIGAATTTAESKHIDAPEKTFFRAVWEYQHRILGSLVLILAWLNVDSGLGLFHERFEGTDGTTTFWVLLVILVVGIILATVKSKRMKQN